MLLLSWHVQLVCVYLAVHTHMLCACCMRVPVTLHPPTIKGPHPSPTVCPAPFQPAVCADESYETPMQPITMMRNSLGREEGGSGVLLQREQYEASVAYWQEHAPIVATESPSGE